jgi:hypothetical protein
MGNASGLMAAAQGISALSGVGNSISQYGAEMGQSKWASQAYKQNAALANMQGRYAMENGATAAGIRGQQAAQLIGRQRAVISSGAADVNTGSAAKVQADTAAAAAQDRAQIMNNAALQRWGFGVEATNYEAQARLAKIAGRYNANSSLISGGLGFARDMTRAAYYGKQAGWFDGKQANSYERWLEDGEVPTKEQWSGSDWD